MTRKLHDRFNKLFKLQEEKPWKLMVLKKWV